MDLYSMCVVFFNQVNIQIQSYFIDQKYQYLKSKPLAKDSEKQKSFEDVKYKKKTTKKVYTNEILQNKRIHKKGKVPLTRGKVNILRVKNAKTKLQQIRKIDNKQSLRKRDIAKKNKLEKREKQYESRKNIQKICVLKEDSKSLKTKSAAEKRKSENETCTIMKKTK